MSRSLPFGAILLAASLAAQASQPVITPPGYVPPPRDSYSFGVPCSVTLQPDAAVIIAGYSARGVSAVEVAERLEKTGAALQRRTGELGGRWIARERLRGAKTLTLRGDKEEPPPYVAVQLVDIEFPADADVDRALDALIPLGLDRFGRRAALEPAAETQAIVFYRVRGLDAPSDPRLEGCKNNVLPSACAHLVHPLCKAPPERVARCVKIDAVQLTGEVNDGRYRESLSLSLPGRPRAVEGAGKGPIALSGTATVSYAVACLEK